MNLMPLYDEAKALYLEGKSLTQIGKELGVDRKKLSKLLKAEGISITQNNQKYNYNDTFFDVIDTEHKAYWLGFLYADGNIDNFAKWEVRLGLAYEDKHHVEKFKDIICPQLPIREYEVTLKGKKYRSAKLCICSKPLVESLIDKGCIPNKSLILKFPTTNQVPEHLIHHFIRGYFDGDGSIGNYTSNKMFRLVGTKEFLNSVHDIFEQNIPGYERTKLGTKQNTEAMQLAKSGTNNIRLIYEYLYKDATVCLERKYDKFLEII